MSEFSAADADPSIITETLGSVEQEQDKPPQQSCEQQDTFKKDENSVLRSNKTQGIQLQLNCGQLNREESSEKSWPYENNLELTSRTYPGPPPDNFLQQSLQRKIKRPIPECQKDDRYWEKRHRNNEAARKSRENKRRVDIDVRQRVSYLLEENALLREELAAIKAKFGLPINQRFMTSPLPKSDTISMYPPSDDMERQVDLVQADTHPIGFTSDIPMKKRRRPPVKPQKYNREDSMNMYNGQILWQASPSPPPPQSWGAIYQSPSETPSEYHQSRYPQTAQYMQIPPPSNRDTISVQHSDKGPNRSVSVLVNTCDQSQHTRPNMRLTPSPPAPPVVGQYVRPYLVNVNHRESEEIHLNTCDPAHVTKTGSTFTPSPPEGLNTMAPQFGRSYVTDVNRRDKEDIRDQLHQLSQEVARMKNYVLKEPPDDGYVEVKL